MGDKRPAPPLPLENKLLKTLSASVGASTGRRGRDDTPSSLCSVAAVGRPLPLENTLLARLSLRASALTSTASSLPLTSSVLTKYEAERHPPPPPAALRHRSRPRARMVESGSDEELFCEDEGLLPSDLIYPETMCLSSTVRFTGTENGRRGASLFSNKSKRRPMQMQAMACGFGGNTSWAQPEPQYDFKGVNLGNEFDDRPTWTSPEQAERPDLERMRTAKLDFLTAVCVSLVSQPNFREQDDALRHQLLRQATELARLEPEFILKVALYSRQELMLRTTSNFLLSLAAFLEPCRPFLKKYFCASIRLPTDWIEVAELYQVFDDSKINFGSLPAALRKVMSDKFAEFDNYQLAKYNKGGGKKKNKAKSKGQRNQKRMGIHGYADAISLSDGDKDGDGDDDGDGDGDGDGKDDAAMPEDLDAETEEQLRRRSFTIKKLVRLLHVRRPVEPVMAIVGKKYPEDPDAFRRSGLPGTFDSSRAGQRMRLPVPETWETQVAQRGNKAAVWQQLIDNRKLPYMAMLRNLRNLILAKIGAAHHDKVISTLTNENAVLNSKQMVFRYLSAYAALDELEETITAALAAQEAEAMEPTDAEPKSKDTTKKKEKGPKRFSKEFWKARRKRTIVAKQQMSKYELHVVRQYRQALDRAVGIATVHNVPPISGRTLIFCDVSERMDHICASAKGMGKPKTARTMALLLALMCQRSSEHCVLVLFGTGPPSLLHRPRNVNLLKQAADEEVAVERRRARLATGATGVTADIDFDSDGGEDQWEDDSEGTSPDPSRPGSRCSEGSSWAKIVVPGYTESQLAEGVTTIEAMLDDCLHQRQWVDNVVVMGSGAGTWHLSRTLQLYRETVNAGMQFVNVDLIHTKAEGSHLKTHPLNVNLFGFSDQILRFVADRGTTGQLAAVDVIDVKYSLRRDIRLPAINLREAILASEAGVGVARWRTVRVFISSTFLDFHGERDLLIRHALPELRSRARALRLDLQVVDLRWGITFQDSESARQVELCLSEIDRCQLFVGLLGARSGQTADTSRLTDPRLLEFLKTQPADMSLTALEMLYATRDVERARETAVFYERDEAFVRRVPGEQMEQFCDLAPGRRRVAELRSQLQSRGCLITKYKAQFGPLGRGRLGATDLQAFGESVLEQLWNTMQARYPLEGGGCDLVTEEYTLQHESAVSRQLIGRKARLARAIEEVERGQGRFVLVSGKPGSGKTSFMARVYAQLVDTSDSVSRLLVPAFCTSGQQCASSAGLVAYLRALLSRQPLSADPRHRQAAELTELLAVRGRRQHVVLVLDGVDALWAAEGDVAADWIPDRLPQNVTVLLSADDGGPLYRRLSSMPMVTSVTLGPLDLSERSGLVRELLQHHSKTLEEKAWNNQLRTLTSKRGAGDPLYLQLACEEMRTFGVFEQLSGKLSSLGQTVSALIQDIIGRLEESFDAAMVKQALCAVTIATHGLAEDDLFEFLKQDWSDLSQFTFTSLLRSGECLIQRCAAPGQPALLRVAHAEMTRGIRSRYMSGPQGPAGIRQLARALAEYFERRGVLQEEKFRWQVPPSVLQALPFFWGLAEDMEQYRRVICSLRFLMLKTQSGLASELLADVRAAQLPDSAAHRLYLEHPHVKEVVEFVSHNLHLFSRSPSLVLQQALNEPADSWLRSCGEELCGEDSQPPGSAVLRLCCQPRSSISEPRPCQMTLRPAEAITAAAADPDREQLYVGLPSGEVKLYDLNSGRETRTFTGHGEPITSLALLCGGVQLVSGAADGQLSVWETSSGRRLAGTKAHRRRVTSLAVQPDGTEFVSVGWSCDIKLWRFRASSGISTASSAGELEEVRVLQRGSRPLSCAAFHPSRPLVAIGGWDGTIKIWDTADMQRKAVRHGHNASVRCLAISPDASYLISGDIDGFLIVWGTKHGDWIQKSRVHNGPIQAVCYLGAEKFVTAGADGDVKLWRSHVGSEVHQVASSSAVMLALSAPHGSVLTVTSAGEVALQPVTPGSSPGGDSSSSRRGAPRWSRRLENITRVACDAHRVYLAVGRAVHVLKMSDGRPERQLAAGAPVTSLACLPPAAADSVMGVVLIGLEDGRVGVALADRGELVTTVAHAGEVTDIAVNVHDPERPRMASGGRDGMVLLWCGEDSWEKPYRTLEAYSVPVSALAWMGDQLITAGQDSQMHVYPLNDDSDERRLLTGNDAPVMSLSVHTTDAAASQSFHMLSGTASGQVLLWSSRLMAVTEQRCRPGSRPDITRLTDGRLVALLPREGDTNVVDLQKMSCIASFGDHTGDISGVATTKRSLVSASLDGSVKLWQPEQTGVASTDAAFLAMELLYVSVDQATCYLATVSRHGHVTVWQLNWENGEMPKALYTANVFEKEAETKQSVLLAAIGSVSLPEASSGGGGVDGVDSVSFSAGCLTAGGLCRLDVTASLREGAGPGTHTLHRYRRQQPANAPVLCLAAGRECSLMLGDSTGRVTVFDAEMQKHAQYRCGVGSDPALTHIRSVGGSMVITCDRNGMLCTLKQTDKLNILRASWSPALTSSVGLTPPPATGCQLDKDTPRPQVPPPGPTSSTAPGYRGHVSGTPTALLTSATEPTVVGDSSGQLWWCVAPGQQYQSMKVRTEPTVVGDSSGQLWWCVAPGQQYQSMKAHSAAVTWLGRDQTRSDVLYSCGEDRRLVVWRQRDATSGGAPAVQQVGEFEFASSVRVCTALPAQSFGSPSRLICGDDRGRLHCLLVDLRRVTDAPQPPPSSASSSSGDEV